MTIKDKLLKKNILVVGDLMIDRYYHGNVKRISPEAPVPVFVKKEEKIVLGGAANVASNLISANQNVIVASVIGNDIFGDELKQMLVHIGCDCTALIQSENRCTSVKTRLLAQNHQQLIRVDEEIIDSINTEEEASLLDMIRKQISDVDAIILSDYLKGVLTYSVCQAVISLAKEKQIPVLIDVKDVNVNKYSGATMLKPNKNELEILTGMNVTTDSEIVKAAKTLMLNANCEYVLATLGSKGMVLVGESVERWIPSFEHEVYDVSGAGDTVISYFSVGLANKIGVVESALISNCAAGIKVTKLGTAPVYIDEVVAALNKKEHIYRKTRKVLTIEELQKELEDRNNKKIVFTNGCFDIIHFGHVGYLREASSYGDLLVIGLNSDASIKRLKGENRPINTQDDRAEVLSAMEFVDYVVIFDEDTPLELIKIVQPDILVKGADYKKEDVVGADFVEARGGSVELIPFLENHSTTAIVNRI